MKDKVIRRYIVRRTVVETYEVYAFSRDNAIHEAGRKGNPSKIEVKAETVMRQRD